MQKTVYDYRFAHWTRRNLTKTLLVMKLTMLFLTAAFLNVQASGWSQTITFHGKNVSLKKVLSAIEEQTGYVAVTGKKNLEGTKTVSLDVSGMPLHDFLELALKDQPLDFVIADKNILLSRKSVPDSAAMPELSLAYPLVTGTVYGPSRQLISGVSVRVRGTNIGTSTNESGHFMLSNLADNAVLQVSSVGFVTVSIPLSGNAAIKGVKTSKIDNGGIDLDITLSLAVDSMETVAVVSNGYQSTPRERATGSFGVITAKQLAQVPVVSVLERIQGMVPGVNVSTKTTAGSSRNGRIAIRGLSTIVSSYTRVNTDPLLIIDGFPSQLSINAGALDFMNPDDIEQITFLKDAAAASIWGFQAANGVIVITTKKGLRNSKPVFNFSTTLGTSKRPRAEYGELMTMKSYIDLEGELVERNIFTSDPATVTSGYYPANNSQAQAIYFSQRRGEITLEERDKQLAALASNNNSDQVSKLLLQSPTTRQYNLSLSGGGINNSYFISGYFYKDDRAYKSNTNKGYSIKASNTSSMANGRVTITSDLSIANTRDKINGAAVRAMSLTEGGLRPYDMLLDANGKTKYYDVITTPGVARTLEGKGYLSFLYSPVDELNYSNTYRTSTSANLNLSVNGIITPWLTATVSGNVARLFGENETYWEPESYEARMLINKATSINSGGVRKYGVPVGGRLDLGNSSGKVYSVRGQLGVNKNWNGRHQFNALAGTEIREKFDKAGGELRYGYDKSVNSFRTVNPTVEFPDMFGSSQTIGATSRPVTEFTTRSLSYFGNASYTLDNKYTVSGSARFDDYNLLGVERRKRAIPLWSGGFKWNAKNESFLKDVSWLSNLALRYTYGFSGNAPQGAPPVTVITLLGNDTYTGQPSGLIAKPAVDNLAWEKTRMINYGLDFSLFKNRISGSVEYYKKHTTDIIWQMEINATYGFANSLFNTANLEGDGVDIGLSFIPVVNQNFKWTSSFNLSYNNNVIKDLRFKSPVGSIGSENPYDGYPTDYLFSYSWAGLDNTGQSLIKDPKVPGKTYTVNENPFYDIRAYSGRTTSPWFGGFGNSIQYKQWDLNFQFIYSFGGVFRKPSITSVGYSNTTNVGRSGDLDKRWRKPGDEAFTDVPGLVFGAGANYFASLPRYVESDYLVRSRSNIRFQQIMLSYSVPPQLLSKVGVRGLTFSAACRNLGMIWAANEEKFDPDYLYTTGNSYQLAPVPAFSFRGSLTF